jgi:hypothetical protein
VPSLDRHQDGNSLLLSATIYRSITPSHFRFACVIGTDHRQTLYGGELLQLARGRTTRWEGSSKESWRDGPYGSCVDDNVISVVFQPGTRFLCDAEELAMPCDPDPDAWDHFYLHVTLPEFEKEDHARETARGIVALCRPPRDHSGLGMRILTLQGDTIPMKTFADEVCSTSCTRGRSTERHAPVPSFQVLRHFPLKACLEFTITNLESRKEFTETIMDILEDLEAQWKSIDGHKHVGRSVNFLTAYATGDDPVHGPFSIQADLQLRWRLPDSWLPAGGIYESDGGVRREGIDFRLASAPGKTRQLGWPLLRFYQTVPEEGFWQKDEEGNVLFSAYA